MRSLLAAAIALNSLAACALDATHAGQSVTLHGRLAMRGNVPFTYAVLIDREQVWELDGLAKDRLQSLQNHQVDVRGTVVRPDAGAGRLPSVRVETVTPQP